MEQTSQYQFNQWARTDRIQMEDFNADNLKLEQALTGLAARAGNCRIAVGSYTGTGTYGSSYATTLNFDSAPLFIAVAGYDRHLYNLASCTRIRSDDTAGSYDVPIYFTWENNRVSWYSDNRAEYQCNSKDTTYYYLALLRTDV